MSGRTSQLFVGFISFLGITFAGIIFWPSDPPRVGPATSVSPSPNSATTDSEVLDNHLNTPGNPVKVFSRNRYNITRLEDILVLLREGALPLEQQRRIALKLGLNASAQTILELENLFHHLAPYVKAAFAEGLGENSLPEGKQFLLDLLKDREQEQIAIRGYIRAVAAIGDEQAVQAIGELLYDPEREESIRIEAALGLGSTENPLAYTLLRTAIEDIDDKELEEYLVEGLGRLPFNQTQEFFQEYMTSGDIADDLRVNALDSLIEAPGDPSPLLIQFISDHDSNVRAAAAWVLSTTDVKENYGKVLLEALIQEPEPHVRKYLYLALQNQTDESITQIAEMVKHETDIKTRLSGFSALAEAVQNSTTPNQITIYFDDYVVPELKSAVIHGDTSAIRLSALSSLQRAETPNSTTALEEISRESKDSRIIRASTLLLENIGKTN